jgi:uncharacterized protein
MTLKKAILESQQLMLQILKEELPADLTYHNYAHTLDVLHATERIAKAENASSEELLLLQTAAIFHDAGYIYSRINHEEKSCNIARELLKTKGVDDDAIEKICDLIMATKVPHNPKDKLAEILCDADLDYLGRDDFFPISQNVFREFQKFGIVKDETEWNQMQVKFLETHRYFTKTSIANRNAKKIEHLEKVRERAREVNS